MPWQKRRPLAEEDKSCDAAAAREKALDLLTGRDFSCAELYERLCRGFRRETAAGAIAAVQRMGFLDDEKYAAQKARSLLAQHKSRRAIADALRRKGLDKPVIEDALAALYAAHEENEETADPETAAALALITRRYARKIAEGRQDLVLAALARRGFSYTVAKRALCLAADETEIA